ncbi:hypothetical protein ACH9L7_14090 [Haloferax sp. S1W]|uniref:hypothetical protein n=1 Tax=Haloferax sp. S1W TaxID=3377110 RepID=UPI0037CBA36C
MVSRWRRYVGGESDSGDDKQDRPLLADGGDSDEGTDPDKDTDSDEGDDNDADTDRTDANPDDAQDEDADDSAAGSGLDRSNIEVTPAGDAEPADPKWEKPDPDDIPAFETGADKPLTRPGGTDASGDESVDPTEGMPNTARSPGDARISSEGTEGYVAALELCARLPDDIRLPEEAADLVPAAVEAELEQDVQSFAASEFDNPSPHVEVLDFVERDGEIWLRLRLGVPAAAFTDLDPDAIRTHALETLDGFI